MDSNELQNKTDTKTRNREHRPDVSQAMSTFTETFGLSKTAAVSVLLFISVVLAAGIFWFVYSAPPRILTITSGPPGSSFERYAAAYRDILSSNHVTLKILPSEGSIENLQRLENPDFHVDIGFVQAGEAGDGKRVKLFSLGSIAYQPLLIFYRSSTPVNLLSDFADKRLAIGPEGSGTRTLALELLATNGIAPAGNTALLDLDAATAAKALIDGNIDAVFLMGDSASSKIMLSLLHSPGIQMFDFTQADAYTRRFAFLNKLQLPRGGIDFGHDLPPHDINLIGPTVELIARADLHPALSDLLLEAAHETNGNASLLQRKSEFPAPLEHEFKISPDATRYYKSGKTFLYRSLPFWLASLVNRVLVAFVPMLIVLIPGLQLIPKAYKWRIQLNFYRWYRNLLKVERELFGDITPAKRKELQQRLDHIEKSVNHMRVPASFAGQFYGLREHISFVRDQLKEE
jgi:NMT1-like family